MFAPLFETQAAPHERRPFLLSERPTAMAFTIRDLSVLAYAQGFTLWHYKAGADRLGTVGAGGYFDAASDMLASGDMMMVSSAEGGRMLCVAACQDGVLTAALA